MKTTIYNIQGEKNGTIDLPNVFSTPIREDLVGKYFEASKFKQPYSSKEGAGLRQQGYGQISHKRHDWKGQYGKGISRVPRKIMSRRGVNFYWVGSNIPGTRGGRKAHPPIGIYSNKKINKKEIKVALNSGFAATSNLSYLKKRYETLHQIDHAPLIVEGIPQNTKQFLSLLKKILDKNIHLALKKKEVRAGKGKSRGRKYKSNAGILVVISSDEKARLKGFNIKPINQILISDLYPLGRLTLYTEKAINELKTTDVKK